MFTLIRSLIRFLKQNYIRKRLYHTSINSPDGVNAEGDDGNIQGDNVGDTEGDTKLLTEKIDWR